MKLILWLVLVIAWCSGKSQDSSVCVQADCRDTTKYPQDTVILNATASATGGIKTIQWSVLAGTATIDNPATSPTIARKLSAGMCVFSLTAVSAYGFVGSASDTTFFIANKPPIAIAGAMRTINTSTFVLSGSNSTDPEGLPLTFSWSEKSGPSVAVINASTMSNPLITKLVNGTYIFSLTVKDRGGLISTTTQTVKVIGNPK